MDDQPGGKCFLKFYHLERWPASWFKNDLSGHEIRLMVSWLYGWVWNSMMAKKKNFLIEGLELSLVSWLKDNFFVDLDTLEHCWTPLMIFPRKFLQKYSQWFRVRWHACIITWFYNPLFLHNISFAWWIRFEISETSLFNLLTLQLLRVLPMLLTCLDSFFFIQPRSYAINIIPLSDDAFQVWYSCTIAHSLSILMEKWCFGNLIFWSSSSNPLLPRPISNCS